MRVGRDQLLQPQAPFVLRQRAQVGSVLLQQVVDAQHHRQFAQQLGAQALAADALLQFGKRLGAAVAPDQDLAIEHRAIGQLQAHGLQFGIAVADQLLAARPDRDLAAALAQQGA